MSSIEIKDPEIDAKKIVQQIRTQVRRRRQAELENLLERRFNPPLPISEDELKVKGSLEEATRASQGWDQIRRRFSHPLPIGEDELELKGSLEEATRASQGWDVQVRRPILSVRPIISALLIRIRKILQTEIRWTLDPILEKQIAFNSHFSEHVLKVLSGLVAVTNELRSSLADLQTSASVLAGSHLDFSEHVLKVLSGLVAVTNELRSSLADLQISASVLAGSHLDLADGQEEMSSALDDNLFEMNSTVSDVNHRLDSAVSDTNHKLTELKRDLDRHDFVGLKIDYAKFQDEYRGSREEIMRRQAAYVHYFKGCKSVLDFGCGRGEFLELLKRNGIAGYGIEIDDRMVEFCRSEGLDVRKVDVLSHLRSLADECLDGVFSAQVVEHMLPADLLDLVALSYRKLRPGGFFVAETVNPGSLYTFSHAFYVDLTHVKPIHPEALLFLLRMNGFRDVKAQFSSRPAVEERLQRIPVDSKMKHLRRLNDNLRKLNDTIFGPQDYAAMGKK
jgi:SAM-dependent methyltransferase